MPGTPVSRLSLTTGPFVTRESGCARAEGEFVFRDQTDGQKQRIARIILFRAGIGFNLSSTALMVTPVTRSFAVNFRHGVTKLQRDAEVIETLDDIALEAAGVRLELCDDVYLRAL